MPKFADYTKLAAPYCPNLPTIVFSRAMLSAAREYFTATQGWQEDIEVNLVQGQFEYELPCPWAPALLDTVISVSIDDDYIGNLSAKLKPENEGTPRYFFILNKTHIQFMPIPSEDKVAVIRVSIKPSIQTEYLPQNVMDEHFEGLLAGAIWQIKRMVGTDWYDPQSALNHRAEFEAFIDQKRIQMLQNDSNNELFITVEHFL